jgi:hypothetical protein
MVVTALAPVFVMVVTALTLVFVLNGSYCLAPEFVLNGSFCLVSGQGRNYHTNTGAKAVTTIQTQESRQ